MKGLLVRAGKYIRQPWRLSVFLKRLGLIALFFALACVVYYWSIRNVSAGRDVILSVILIWLATAYYLLPRIHRLLSRMYVPNYFIGRARTADGLLADPVNLAVRGNLTQLKKAMQKAGWEVADPITLRSSWGIVKATLRRRSYETAPVSDMYVFGQKQQIAFQKEVDGNPAKRHHVRFWQVPRGMYLPGGYKVNWVGGATYDDAVGLSLFTLQITHRIDGDVDAERNFVVQTLESAKTVDDVQKIEHFFPKYSHHNGINGSKFFTDGSMVIVDLKRVER